MRRPRRLTTADFQNKESAELVRVRFALDPDEDGWPPVTSEGLWARPLGGGLYELENTPWFACGVAFGDHVRAEADDQGVLWFVESVRWSGRYTVRVIPLEGMGVPDVVERFVALGADAEGALPAYKMVALDIPAEALLEEIKRELRRGEEMGMWGFDEGRVDSRWQALRAATPERDGGGVGGRGAGCHAYGSRRRLQTNRSGPPTPGISPGDYEALGATGCTARALLSISSGVAGGPSFAARGRMRRMSTQYYTATSIDGYIADVENSLDWLFEVEAAAPHEETFGRFIQGVGAMSMGSTTYEWMLGREQVVEHPDKWRRYFGDTPCWVFTHRALAPVPGADITFVRGDVATVHAEMVEAADGRNVWLVGGGDLVGQFADRGLLEEIILDVAPVTLGDGAPLLPRRLGASRLELVDLSRNGQFARLTYRLHRA